MPDAADYLFEEEVTPRLVERVIRHAIERHALLGSLRELAHYDVLTGLANRTLVTDRLRLAMARADRTRSLAAVLFFFNVPLLGMFTGDAEVIAIGSRLLRWQAGSFFFLGFYFVFFRALQGAGDVVVPMVLSLATSLAISLPMGIYLSHGRGMGPDGLFVAQFVGVGLGTLLMGAWVATGRWTTARARAATRGVL